MKLSEIYQKGKEDLSQRDIGFTIRGVETEFVLTNNRAILDRYTFNQKCIDAPTPSMACSVLGVNLAAPVIMSAMTMPIPAIVDNGMLELAQGLKEAGSLLWTGTPIPDNLAELVKTGVPVAANVKPHKDRRKLFEGLETIQAAGVQWVGLEIDSGQGTKILDQLIARDCSPLSFKELVQVRESVEGPLIFKGVLSREDAEKSLAAGADGIVISNHGAHTLDYLPHPLQVMDQIVKIVDGKCPIIVDGGFRRGSDTAKGLAFGANLVGLGRPILYGLAADGRNGVKELILQITEELKRIMSMLGASEPHGMHRDMLIDLDR
jgi:isopentenyl diphosphate isomerase/L-lactate dehydrogenase-like FMN-dependent dehydrogenase